MNSKQKERPSASHQKVWEQQMIKTKYRNGKQQISESTISSAAIKLEAESIDGEGEVEGIGENEPMKMEEEEEDDEELEMFPPENVDGNAQKKSQKLEELIHTRQLLEGVLCPWEKIQQFIQIFPHDYCTLSQIQANAIGCIVAFHFHIKERCSDQLIYIDQINEINPSKIRFEHYGTFEIDSIEPHYGTIGDEDFTKWLDKLISTGEELPNNVAKLEAKKQLVNILDDSISTAICEQLQPNPKMLFHRFIDQIDEQILEPLGMDISPIILQPKHFHLLLKLSQSEFEKLMTGLYLQVKISKIAHSMKLPPMMTLLDHLLIPISRITFDLPNYKIPHLAEQMTCKVMVHVKDGKGDVVCVAKLPREMKLRSQELIQTSVAIWRMNNIPLPIFDHVHQKTKQLNEAFVSAEKIIAREKLPLREQIRENAKRMPENVQRINQIGLTKKKAKKQRLRARILEMGASIGIVGDGNRSKQEIWQQNVRRLNRQMPPNFAKIIIKKEQFWRLHRKLSTEQLKELVVGMFVHVKFQVNYKFYSMIDLKGHLIVPITDLISVGKKGKERMFIFFPQSIKLCTDEGTLSKRISVNQIEESCGEHLIEECAMILNICKIEPPTEEFIAQKEQELRHWL